ncbi:MAG: thioredoxin family protein [Phycisphaerales bacterium]|jgi:peroxiredoxin
MAVTASEMLPLGTAAPDFNLPDTTGNRVSLRDFEEAQAFLVIFMCNHCPFVKHVLRHLVELAREYQTRRVAVVGINSNDVASFPDDRPELMAEAAKEAGFTFPYLYDETQEVAKAYRAACTPDFFLFDGERTLVYRGQMDDSRPGNEIPVTGADLTAAIDAVLEGKPVSEDQKPSMGCNIKWKQGNEPDYA